MPSDIALKAMNCAHRSVIKPRRGHLAHDAAAMPVPKVVPAGRKSGTSRSVLLIEPVRDGDRLVVLTSRDGDDTQPAWLLNVRENADVEVALRSPLVWLEPIS